jgi:ABC-type transport system involved in multi-copper enzyme maturation permease subunit
VSRQTNVTLLWHAWRRHRIPLVTIGIAIGLFEFILTRLAPAPNEVSWVSGLLMTLPPEMRALIGNDVALSAGGFLALGYGHPFFILLMSAWVVRTGSAGVAGEIGMGTMDLLASRPVPRWHFVAAGMATVAAGLGLVVACAWIGTAIGLRTRPLDLGASAFLPLAAAAWLLFAAWGAVGILIGATRRDGGQAVAWITAMIAASFVLDYLARLWAPISALRPLSLFRYYEPQAIFASGIPADSLLALASTLAACLAAALVVIQRRDL